MIYDWQLTTASDLESDNRNRMKLYMTFNWGLIFKPVEHQNNKCLITV